MGNLNVLILLSVFLFASTFVGFIFLMWSESHFNQKKQIKRRLVAISAGGMHGKKQLKLYRDKTLKDGSIIERVLLSMPRLAALDRMLIRSKLPLNVTGFVLLSLTLGAACFALAATLGVQPALTLALAPLGCVLPYFYLKYSERVFLSKFNDQCPEALDLMARAIRSGNALSSALGMVAEEMQDPIRTEFATIVDEIKLGLTLNEALDNLCDRVPLPDVNFFSISVQIQKETGGNVAEIFDNLSRLIRERVQFRRQVKALTAEGRISAIILISLPILLFGYLYIFSYDYISLLWSRQVGIYMIGSAVFLQILGYFVIKKIVRVEI